MEENKAPSLLLISQGSAFMVNSLENSIKKEGISVTRCAPNVREVDENINDNDIILLFAGDFIENTTGLISYIASKCSDECVQFCIVGYPNEIQNIEKNIDISQITAEFTRPFDMKEFTAQIKALAHRESAMSDVKLQDTGSAGKDSHNILLCDDDMMFLKMVQEWLNSKYHVTIVKTGLMAVPFALNNQPELILLDYEMPVMNGPKVLEALRGDKKTAQIPVVFLTGHSDKDSVMEVMKLRPQGYLLKSTKKEDLVASVDNFFATRQWKNIQT